MTRDKNRKFLVYEKEKEDGFVEEKNYVAKPKTRYQVAKFILRFKSKGCRQKSARDNRICDFSWSFGSNSNFSYRNIQTKIARALGLDRKWNELSLKRTLGALGSKIMSSKAQSSVEFAIVAIVILIIALGVGSIANRLNDGTFVDHAIASASHNIENSFGGLIDVFAY